ncbi:Spo0B domain-containing protein [Paenibacillus sp. JX-17]|uniref:Spo0B domain-containing protein n=1 Tax=Paenibacillus lacisoli TaxID=3064525 RepID=A0ABT9CC87_9BACL|nr:Spo0B domain-containing protein [Paenibacillus sp. JX-17]MDO7906875.1 Spo0B domain-containing protein [Paenibacillus sp. JX-17]
MRSWTKVPLLTACSILIPLVFIFVYPTIVTLVAAVIWCVGSVMLAVQMLRRTAEQEKQQLLRTVQGTAISTLNHHRHDWMNDLQVLYGYIRLGKHDKTVQCVERIKERVAEESKIAKLGIPSLVFFLQSFRSYGANLELHVEVQDQMQLGAVMSPEDGESLATAVMDTVRAYQYSGGRSSWGEVRSLTIYFTLDQGDAVVRFEASEMEDPELLHQIVKALEHKHIVAEQSNAGQASFQFRMPCGI